MNTETPWQECFVDPERGVAFFDGITIEADSIHDPRQDRVFPIFKKEQVFMCRQMLPLFREWNASAGQTDQRSRPPLALDVGTGSGVLAIFAAIHGCKVYALDISRRSIEFARHNIQANRVPVFEFTNWRDFEEASQPGVWLRQIAFDEDFVTVLLDEVNERAEGCFDFILLNPPYNPTFERVTPALHAAGGGDGQGPFKQQIKLVPRLLRNGGHCAGHHMGVIAEGQRVPNIISLIEAAFSATNQSLASETAERPQEGTLPQYGTTVKYVKVLDSDRNVRTFLKAQYATFLASKKHGEAVREYIDLMAKDWSLFTLLYFEFQKLKTPVDEDSSVSFFEMENCKARPARSKHASASRWKWETREWVHRCIVEHATSPISIPWSSLFTDYVVSEQMLFANESKSANGGRLLESSPMRLIDQWLAELPPFHQAEPAPLPEAVDETEERWPAFDFVHVESVPFTPNSARLPGLRQESALWLSPFAGGGIDDGGEAFARHCFAAWAACVKNAHARAFAPFLHAAFMGTVDSGSMETGEITEQSQEYRNWNPLLHSFLRDSPIAYPPVRPDDMPTLDRAYKSFDTYFNHARAKLWRRVADDLQPHNEDENPVALDGKSPYLSYYSTKGLDELKVADVNEYRRKCKDRLREIGGVDSPCKWLIDLEYCHATLHGLAVQAFAATGHLPAPLKWSYLLSVPLDLSDPLYESDQGVLPSTFRGSIFLFVGSFRTEWSPRQDRLVHDLARFTTLLYNGRFNVEEARSQSFDVLESMGRSFSHEMLAHKLAMNATHQTMDSVFHFEGSKTLVPLATDGSWQESLGAVIKAPEDRLQSISSWLVCTTPKIYTAFEDTLSIWGSSLNWRAENGLNRDRTFPDAFASIIVIVGRAAFAAGWSKSLAGPRHFAAARAKDDEFDHRLTELTQALASVNYEGESGQLEWVGADDAVGAQFTFLRIMRAALSNAVKHLPKGSSAIHICTSWQHCSDIIRIEIQNDFRYQKPPKSRGKWGTEKVIDTLIRDRWGPRSISFEDIDAGQTEVGQIHRWRTSFEIPITYTREGRRIAWLRRL